MCFFCLQSPPGIEEDFTVWAQGLLVQIKQNEGCSDGHCSCKPTISEPSQGLREEKDDIQEVESKCSPSVNSINCYSFSAKELGKRGRQ